MRNLCTLQNSKTSVPQAAYPRLYFCTYVHIEKSSPGIGVLRTQFDPVLSSYTPLAAFSPDKLDALKARALTAQEAIYSYGVYHGDMEARNFLWNSDTMSLTLIDFGEATFKNWNYFPLLGEGEARIKNDSLVKRKEIGDDIEMMWSMLRDFGVKDERDSFDISFLVPKISIVESV